MLNRNLNRPMAPSRAVAQPGAPAASRAGAFPRGAVAVAILFMGELRRSWVLFRRYPLQAISGIGMTLFLFLGLVFGARYMAGPMARFGDRLGSLVVGYILWNVLIFAMGEIAMGLQGEAQIGTLEQLFLSPRSMVTVFLVRALANQVLILGISALALVIILVTTGVRLDFPPVLVLPLLSALTGVYGLGFVLGSLVLVFKRIGPVLSFAQFGLALLIMPPFESGGRHAFDAFDLLPLVPSAVLLRDLMARSLPLDLPSFVLAVANGIAYLALGVLTFHWAQKRAMEQGLLGSY